MEFIKSIWQTLAQYLLPWTPGVVIEDYENMTDEELSARVSLSEGLAIFRHFVSIIDRVVPIDTIGQEASREVARVLIPEMHRYVLSGNNDTLHRKLKILSPILTDEVLGEIERRVLNLHHH